MSELDLEPGRRDVYSPSRLNREAASYLKSGFPPLWIEGELSNLGRPSSGHVYFTLKDAQAQVRCALFRGRARYLRFEPADGDAVLLRGQVSLYEGRGEFQLIVEHMEPAGEGALQRELERLKRVLNDAGLFSQDHKQALPRFPRRVGVVSSATGAALQDVLHVLRRRFAAIPVRLYPVPVQGAHAAPAIARALALAGERRDCDVLILTRGGGSLEDLWAFNEETVARAIFDCPVPLISAVGHEVDVTIADLVADLRAPTPSAAAELAVPDGAVLAVRYQQLDGRLAQLISRSLHEGIQSVDRLESRMQRVRPDLRLRRITERLLELRRRLVASIQRELAAASTHMMGTHARLRGTDPSRLLRAHATRRESLRERLLLAQRHLLRQYADRHLNLTRSLAAVAPQATLNRGYAIVTLDSGQVVRSIEQLQQGSRIDTQLAQGRFSATVDKRNDD